MGLIAKENSSNNYERILPPAGNHLAICYSVIDLGTHDEEYLGNTKKVHKIRIAWELPDEKFTIKDKEGNEKEVCHRISKEYTLSLGERANLRKDLESWRGREFTEKELAGFDLQNLLEVPCMINIIHKTSKQGREYAVVSSIAKAVKGLEIPELSRITEFFSFEDEPLNEVLLNSLPEYLQNKIKESYEYQYLVSGAVNDDMNAEDEPNDDIPF